MNDKFIFLFKLSYNIQLLINKSRYINLKKKNIYIIDIKKNKYLRYVYQSILDYISKLTI